MRRVAITGVGIVTAIGIGIEEFSQALMECKCGVMELQEEAVKQLRSRTAYRITTPIEQLLPTQKAYIDRCSALTLASCWLALKDAKLEVTDEVAPHLGICHGTAYGCQDSMLIFWERIMKRGFRYASSIMFTHAYMNTPISLAAIEFNLKGYHCCYSAGMTSGMQAVVGGVMALQRSLSKRLLAGGTEAFSLLSFMANYESGELSPRDEGVEQMRPFDSSRNGWVMGEGACMLLLETEEASSERGADALAYISGVGMAMSRSVNVDDMTDAIYESMTRSLNTAHIEPDEIGWICASANGSPTIDMAEALAISRLYEGRESVPVSSIKSAVGETIGASGPINIGAVVASLRTKSIPPTLFSSEPCVGMRIVTDKPMSWDATKPVLVNCVDKDGMAISLVVAPP
jgi:3-oxoacyl-(acyl-carrier-protein) synthase